MREHKMKNKFEQDLARVKDAIVAASEHYNIHYICTNAHDRPKYVNTMNRYLGFFRTSISAQFTAMLLTLSKVLDKNTKNNRISLYSLIELAQKHEIIKPVKLKEIKDALKETNEMFGKLQILRNNHFAHLGSLNSQESFKRAGISPNDVRELIDSSIEILTSIYYAYDRCDFTFDYGSKKDTYVLLDDLLKMSN